MKKSLLTIGLAAITALAHGQGTIAFGNSALTRVQILSGGTFRNATAADGLNFYVFFGPAGVTADALTQVQQPDPKAAIGTTAGVMINAPSVFALPGTEPGQIVSLQIRAWNADRSLCLETRVIQVALAPTVGPGTVIWQTPTGTNPNRFTPMIICPEPSTFALGALGGLFLLFFRRKSARNWLMKKLLLTIGLAAITAFAHGQGTIAFGNSALTRVQVCGPGGTVRNATAADGLNFYVFFGQAGTHSGLLTQVQQPDPKAAIGPTAGVMINAPSVFALPGTEGGQVVSLQIRAWNADRSLFFETDVRQVTLAPTAGPGTVIWQTATGTNPNRFYPFICPEPSTLALGTLAGLLLLFFPRKSTRN